jgi:predicted DCC family thiol-disulfide oxidoreductase YuxK
MSGNATLPAREHRPDAELVIYDGQCRFCLSQMRLLHATDLTRRLAFLSLHDSACNALLPEMSVEQRMEAMIVLGRDGRRHAGARAVRYLSRRLPALWILAPLLHIPGSLPFWENVYGRIARVRYRFGRVDCDSGACQVRGYPHV